MKLKVGAGSRQPSRDIGFLAVGPKSRVCVEHSAPERAFQTSHRRCHHNSSSAVVEDGTNFPLPFWH